MSLEPLIKMYEMELRKRQEKGVLKGAEKVICGLKKAEDGKGPRYFLQGYGEREFLRMNSNSYLGLSLHPEVIEAGEKAAGMYGAGPGAVRFISGTYEPHIGLEDRLANFHGREACMIFSSAYSAVMGVVPQLISDTTTVISDSLNHNCIINAIRLAGTADKKIYAHLDMADLKRQIESCVGTASRLCIVTDGIFSMRGDFAPLNEIERLRRDYEHLFSDGIITVVDDSHGVGAFGSTGRGVEEYMETQADILIATLGKAFGVNGGYVVSKATVIRYLRQVSPFYVYSNPITVSEAAAALTSLAIVDSPEGRQRLEKLRSLVDCFEKGLAKCGFETIASPHPVVPLLIRNTEETLKLVHYLFEHNVLVTALFYPVVPKGDEEIRFQLGADQTEKDIDYILNLLDKFKRS